MKEEIIKSLEVCSFSNHIVIQSNLSMINTSVNNRLDLTARVETSVKVSTVE